MADIKKELSNIKTATYGRDVRGSIHDGIDKINKESEKSKSIVEDNEERQNSLEQQFDDLQRNYSESTPSTAEVVAARTNADTSENYNTIGRRMDEEYKRVTSQLNDIAVNVKMFGAIGDGLTDDTRSIKDAIDFVGSFGGGVVYIPSGTYKISSVLFLKNNVKIVGAGRGLTTIRTVDFGTDYQYVFYANGQANNRMKNISISDLTLNPLDETPTRTSLRFYNTIRFNYTDGFVLSRIENLNGHTCIASSESSDFVMSDITCENNSDSVIALFSGTKKGIMKNITGINVDEVADFFNSEDIQAYNLYGFAGGLDNEAIDFSSSSKILIKDSTFIGFKTGFKLKVEGDIPLDDYTIDNCEVLDFKDKAVEFNFGSVTSVDDTVWANNVSIKNCLFTSEIANTSGIFLEAIEKVVDIKILENDISVKGEGVKLSGNHSNAMIIYNDIKSGRDGILISGINQETPINPLIEHNKIHSSQNGILMDRCYYPSVRFNKILDAGNIGIYLKNTKSPNCSFNSILSSGLHAIHYNMQAAKFLNRDKKDIGAVISFNSVENFGATSNYRSGLLIEFNMRDSNHSILNNLSIQGNKITRLLDNTNITYGIHFLKGDLEGIDYVSLVDNTVSYTTEKIHNRIYLLSNSIIKDNIEIT